VARCLSSAAQNASRFEEFEAALRIGMDLEASLERDPGQHSDCCAPALRELLPEASLERMLELWLKKRTDPVFSKTVASFLKWAGARGGEIVLQSLEDETSATNRIRLVRLAAQLGPDMLEAARKRLEDPRWFVVRNACNVLSALDDEHLPELLEKILLHSDVRVQQAAVTALAKSKAPSRAETLAKALLQLQPHLQEMVFDELIHLKDPATVFWLEIFLRAGSSLKAGILEKAVQALAAVSTDSAVEALRKVLYDAGQPPVLRRAALAGLKGSPLPAARQVLTEFSQLADPLAEEYRKMAAAKKR
jgi:HEAT repeat protein